MRNTRLYLSLILTIIVVTNLLQGCVPFDEGADYSDPCVQCEENKKKAIEETYIPPTTYVPPPTTYTPPSSGVVIQSFR